MKSYIRIITIFSCTIIWFITNNCSNNSQQEKNENFGTITNVDTFQKKGIYETIDTANNLYRNYLYKFRIKFPISWNVLNGDGIHIVKKAVIDNGEASVIVFVKDYYNTFIEDDTFVRELLGKKAIQMSDKQKRDFFENWFDARTLSNEVFNIFCEEYLSGYNDSRFPNKILEKEIRYIDGIKALYLLNSSTTKKLNYEMSAITINYVTIYKGKVYALTGGVDGSVEKRKFSLYEKQIIKSIASFVFEDSFY